MVFEPLDFIARLAALVPKPRVHLTRFHGVFAPNSKHRAKVTGEMKVDKKEPTAMELLPEGERRMAMSWAMRLKRVFNIDITLCRHCEGCVKIIACIEDTQVISKILAHINHQKEGEDDTEVFSIIRAPPRHDFSKGLNH